MTTIAEATLTERYEGALQDVQESQQHIERLRKELSEYQSKTGLIVRNGVPVSFASPTAEGAYDVHAWLADYKRRYIEADQQFQQSLSVWAGLKTEIEKER